MKILQKMCFVLLLGTLSSVYGGSCGVDGDVDDCRVRAEQGDARAQFNLGLSYYNGLGVRQNYKEAVRWFRKSAEQGIVRSQYNLGRMYATGQGVIQDYVMAHMYWSIAAVSGDEWSIENKGRAENIMTDSQLEESQKLAREWMRKQKREEVGHKSGSAGGIFDGGWYENGQKKSEEYYIDGGRLQIAWYENGQKIQERTIKSGELDGLYSTWHENGQDSSRLFFKNGKAEGLETSWFENGQKHYELNYKNGVQEGLYTIWDKEGNVTYIYKCHLNRCSKKRWWDW